MEACDSALTGARRQAKNPTGTATALAQASRAAGHMPRTCNAHGAVLHCASYAHSAWAWAHLTTGLLNHRPGRPRHLFLFQPGPGNLVRHQNCSHWRQARLLHACETGVKHAAAAVAQTRARHSKRARTSWQSVTYLSRPTRASTCEACKTLRKDDVVM